MSDERKSESPVSADSWLEWRAKCTIGNCSKTTAGELATFGRSRLYTYLKRLDAALAEEICRNLEDSLSSQRAWILLEAHLYAGRDKNLTEQDGKSYKDIAFVFGTSPTKLAQYLSATFEFSVARTVAFENGWGFRLKEGRKPACIKEETSLDADVHRSEGPSINEKLWEQAGEVSARQDNPDEDAEVVVEAPCKDEVDPVEEDEARSDSVYIEPDTDQDALKCQGIADAVALKFWNSLSERERLIQLFLSNGLTAQDMERSGLFDCCQSTLYTSRDKLFTKIRELDWGYEIDYTERQYFTRLFIPCIKKYASKWIEGLESGSPIRSKLVETLENRNNDVAP